MSKKQSTFFIYSTFVRRSSLFHNFEFKKLYDKFKQILESSFLFDFIQPFTTNIWNEIKNSKKSKYCSECWNEIKK